MKKKRQQTPSASRKFISKQAHKNFHQAFSPVLTAGFYQNTCREFVTPAKAGV
jgi:hypothetical protein